MHRGLNTCECSSTSGVWGRTHCWGEAVPSVLKSKQVAKRGAPGCSPHPWQSSWQIHVWGQHDDESCQLMKQIRCWRKSWMGRTRAQNEQGLLDSSIGSGLNPQWTVRVQGSRWAGQNQVWPGQLWGRKKKKKPKTPGHWLSHPKDKTAILYSEAWTVLKVSHSGDIWIWLLVQREILCQQHSCANSLCKKDQVKKRQPGSEREGYQIAPRPALHIESTWPHC